MSNRTASTNTVESQNSFSVPEVLWKTCLLVGGHTVEMLVRDDSHLMTYFCNIRETISVAD